MTADSPSLTCSRRPWSPVALTPPAWVEAQCINGAHAHAGPTPTDWSTCHGTLTARKPRPEATP